MKNTSNYHQPAKSLYTMLAHSEHEERSAYEGAVYMLFILSAVFSIWQVAHQPVVTPTALGMPNAQFVQSTAGAPHRGA